MSRRRGPGLAIFLLVAQLLQVGLDRIPPVTLSVIGLNTVIHLGLLEDFVSNLPSLEQACVSVANVYYGKEWSRILFSPFFHVNDWHIYYNMLSFLWKGMTLERSLGRARFFSILAVFSTLTSLVLLGLDFLMARLLNDNSYLYTCAAGFSGVIFALKVLITANSQGGTEYIMGIPFPTRYAYWAELLIIQLLVPNVSFTGHLAGIIVGLMYTKGPLKGVMDWFGRTVSGGVRRPTLWSGPSYTYHSGTTGGVQQRHEEDEDAELLEAIRRSRQETQFTQPSSHQDEVDDPELQQAIQDSLSERQESTVRRRPTEQEVREMRLKRFNEPKKEV